MDVKRATATLNNAAPATLSPLVKRVCHFVLAQCAGLYWWQIAPVGAEILIVARAIWGLSVMLTSANVADLDADVLAFDPQNPSAGFTTAVTFGLNYSRELSAVFTSGAHSGHGNRGPMTGLRSVQPLPPTRMGQPQTIVITCR